MCYRCDVCRTVTPPGQHKLTWNVKRPNGQIAKQLAVCDECHYNLNRGVELSSIRAMMTKYPKGPVKPPSEAQKQSQLPPHLRFPKREVVVVQQYGETNLKNGDHSVGVVIPVVMKTEQVVQPGRKRKFVKLYSRKHNQNGAK